MVLENSGFHAGKNFSENYLLFGHAPSKVFARSILGCKILKNIGLNGRQIVSVLMVPTCLGPALLPTY
jgi:hypothetical protein